MDLLAEAQREVGERWYCNELTPADEHLASGVTAAALDTLMDETSPPAGDNLTVVTCAEGDFHSLAAQMFGELLREYGIGATVLGASTPADAVADYLARSGAGSLAISCSVHWLQNLLVQRGVPPQALMAGLESLRPVVADVDTGAARLLDLGRQELLDRVR